MESTRTSFIGDEVDVVIVGAGPTGAVTAKRLSEAGHTVVVLERGDWQDYSSMRADEVDYELTPGRDWSNRPSDRGRPWDTPIDETHSDIGPLMWNGVGGSVMCYGGHWQRNMPSDFRTKSLEGVGDDWPVTYNELLPYYRTIEKEYGVSGMNGDPAFPGTDFPMPPVRLKKWGRKLAAGQNKLGWHWWPGSNAIATIPFGPLRPTTEMGTEQLGSPDGSKSTPDIMYWPIAIANGVELRVRSTVTRVETNALGLATGVLYTDENGKEQRQRARVVILGANAIMTPWLLLSSKTDRFPDGLANSSGLVGKRLMMHPFSTVVGVFDDELDSWEGNWGQQLYSVQFYDTDESRGFARGAKWGGMPTGGPLFTTYEFPWGKSESWGEDFHQTLRSRLGHSAMWGIVGEDLPEESNTVTLNRVQKDSFGQYIPEVTYTISENSTKLLRWHEERAAESLMAAGARSTVVAPAIRNSGWHLLGTAVMGDDPERSVVDGEGRCHDIPNLFVFDGSIWPTSSGTNPTGTIVALALRNTERLIANRASQVTPS